jgi:hypothetical protein
MKSYIYKFILFIFVLFSCQANETVSPEQSFNKIYNEGSFSDFEGANIQQLDDEGYLLLGIVSNSFSGKVGVPYLLRTDKNGNLLWDTNKTNLLQTFFNPIPNFKKKDGSYFFFCRNNADKSIVLLKINDANQSISVQRTFNELKGDLVYVSETPDKGLLLMLLSESCDSGKQPELVKLDINFDIQWRKCYPYTAIPSINIITQKITLNYFFNGIFEADGQVRYFMTFLTPNNTSFVLYTDASGNLLGSTQTSFLLNSLAQVSGKEFAMTYIRQNDTNIVPKVALSINTNESPAIFGNTFHEINSEKRIITKKMTLNGKNVIIFACTLENIPIRIYAFDAQTEVLLGTLTLGRVNPYEIADIIQTADGGLAILANTLVADRFIRLALLKISPKEIINLVN